MGTIYVKNDMQLRDTLMRLGLTTDPLPVLPVEFGTHRIEWTKPSVVDALKRLERAGDEHSRATEKLRQAAYALSEHLRPLVPQREELPRGYQYHYDVLCSQVDCEVWREVCEDRETALAFARNIATGWLDDLATWLEKRAAEDETATRRLENAKH
jgi:hypothetical protein